VEKRRVTMAGLKSAARLALLVVFMSLGLLVGLALTESKRDQHRVELKKIKNFLMRFGPSDGPEIHIELIRSQGNQFNGTVVPLMLRLTFNSGCNELENNRIELKDLVLMAQADKTLRELWGHIAGVFLTRCGPAYELKLSKALWDIGETQRNNLMTVLNEKSIESSRRDSSNDNNKSKMNPDLIPAKEPGQVFNQTLPHILGSIGLKLPRKGKELLGKALMKVLRVARVLAQLLSKSCPAYHERSQETVSDIRLLTSMTGARQSANLHKWSNSFKTNLFRHKFCEDIVRVGRCRRALRSIRKWLGDHTPSALMVKEWVRKHKKGFVRVAKVALSVTVIVVILVVACLAHTLTASFVRLPIPAVSVEVKLEKQVIIDGDTQTKEQLDIVAEHT